MGARSLDRSCPLHVDVKSRDHMKPTPKKKHADRNIESTPQPGARTRGRPQHGIAGRIEASSVLLARKPPLTQLPFLFLFLRGSPNISVKLESEIWIEV